MAEDRTMFLDWIKLLLFGDDSDSSPPLPSLEERGIVQSLNQQSECRPKVQTLPIDPASSEAMIAILERETLSCQRDKEDPNRLFDLKKDRILCEKRVDVTTGYVFVDLTVKGVTLTFPCPRRVQVKWNGMIRPVLVPPTLAEDLHDHILFPKPRWPSNLYEPFFRWCATSEEGRSHNDWVMDRIEEAKREKTRTHIAFVNFKSHFIFERDRREALLLLLSYLLPTTLCMTESLVPFSFFSPYSERQEREGEEREGEVEGNKKKRKNKGREQGIDKKNERASRFFVAFLDEDAKSSSQTIQQPFSEGSNPSHLPNERRHSSSFFEMKARKGVKRQNVRWADLMSNIRMKVAVFANPLFCPYGSNWGNVILANNRSTIVSVSVLHLFPHADETTVLDELEALNESLNRSKMTPSLSTKAKKALEGIRVHDEREMQGRCLESRCAVVVEQEDAIVCATHLEDADDSVRREQARILEAGLRPFQKKGKPIALIGDMNSLHKEAYTKEEWKRLTILSGSELPLLPSSLTKSFSLCNGFLKHESLLCKNVCHSFIHPREVAVFADCVYTPAGDHSVHVLSF